MSKDQHWIDNLFQQRSDLHDARKLTLSSSSPHRESSEIIEKEAETEAEAAAVTAALVNSFEKISKTKTKKNGEEKEIGMPQKVKKKTNCTGIRKTKKGDKGASGAASKKGRRVVTQGKKDGNRKKIVGDPSQCEFETHFQTGFVPRPVNEEINDKKKKKRPPPPRSSRSSPLVGTTDDDGGGSVGSGGSSGGGGLSPFKKTRKKTDCSTTTTTTIWRREEDVKKGSRPSLLW